MRVHITKTVSLSMWQLVGYLAPATLAMIVCGIFVPTKMLAFVVPALCLVNGLWWAWLWQHKLRAHGD